jgi:3-oxoacyl-[acyl-carrier-protein] synthase II
MSSLSDVVVTGVGPVTAIGIGVSDFWTSLLAGKKAVGSLARRDDGGPVPAENWQQTPMPGAWIGAPIVGFDGAMFVRPRKAMKVMGRELQTAFAAASLAMDQAELQSAINDRFLQVDRIATVFGSQMFYGPISELREAIQRSRDPDGRYQLSLFGDAAMREIIPLWMLKYLPNMPACHVGISVGATGANNTIVSGDVSSTSALIESLGVIKRGIADIVVCGGSGTLVDSTRMVYRGDHPIPEVADPIESSSRPHTLESRGIVGGEGAGAIVLETAHNARNRGAAPLAMVAGAASRFSGVATGHRGSSQAIRLAIQSALDQAGITADEIGLVISNGTGDPLRDAAEKVALDQTLPTCPITMPIGSLGHMGAANGAIYLVIAVLAIHHGLTPPSFLNGKPAPDWKNRFADSPGPLSKRTVAVLTHTSQGVANAVILRSAE